MARGVKVDDNIMPALSANFQVNRNTIAEDAFGIATQASINGGSYTISGSIGAAYRPTELLPLINLVLGGSDGKMKMDGTFSTTTVYIEDDYDNVTTIETAIINSLEFALATEDFARITFNYTGTSYASGGSAITSADYTDDLAIFYNALLTVASVSVYAKSLTLRIERPLTPDYIIGSEYAVNLNQSGNITVSGSLGLAASEYTLLAAALTTGDEGESQPRSANKNELTGGTLLINLMHPNGTTAYQTITIKNLKITTGSMSAEGRQVATKNVDFVAAIASTGDVEFGPIT